MASLGGRSDCDVPQLTVSKFTNRNMSILQLKNLLLEGRRTRLARSQLDENKLVINETSYFLEDGWETQKTVLFSAT